MKRRMVAALLVLALAAALLPPAAAAEGEKEDAELVEALKGFFAQAEGDYGSVNRNDGGACSLGLLQWHGPRALELLRFALAGWPGAANYLTQALYGEIVSETADWSHRTLTESEARCVSALLDSADGRAAQDAVARRDILGYLHLCRSWGMKTDATAAYFAVIVNQFGAGGAKSYLRHIRQTLGVGEDAAFINLKELHQAVHDTLSYGQPWLPMRDKCYAYIVSLGWNLTGQPRLAPLPLADSLLARLRARDPDAWRLGAAALALLLCWRELLPVP